MTGRSVCHTPVYLRKGTVMSDAPSEAAPSRRKPTVITYSVGGTWNEKLGKVVDDQDRMTCEVFFRNNMAWTMGRSADVDLQVEEHGDFLSSVAARIRCTADSMLHLYVPNLGGGRLHRWMPTAEDDYRPAAVFEVDDEIQTRPRVELQDGDVLEIPVAATRLVPAGKAWLKFSIPANYHDWTEAEVVKSNSLVARSAPRPVEKIPELDLDLTPAQRVVVIGALSGVLTGRNFIPGQKEIDQLVVGATDPVSGEVPFPEFKTRVAETRIKAVREMIDANEDEDHPWHTWKGDVTPRVVRWFSDNYTETMRDQGWHEAAQQMAMKDAT